MTLVNMIGATFVSRVASVMVVVLLGVFAVFIVVTISDVNFDLLAFSGYPSFSKIISSIALTFFAFLGFGVMTFTVAKPPRPRARAAESGGPRAGTDDGHYVLISIGVFGTLTVDQAIGYGETAIAEAARPTLGDAGFTLMAVAALIATAGATNGTLFGSASLTASLAEIGQFPPILGPRSRLGKHGGLLVTAILALVLANFVDLSAIASVGSACSLVVFLLVGLAGYRLRSETGASAADRPARHGGDRDRARILRRRHAPQRSRDVRGDRRDDAAGGRPRRRLEAGEGPLGRHSGRGSERDAAGLSRGGVLLPARLMAA